MAILKSQCGLMCSLPFGGQEIPGMVCAHFRALVELGSHVFCHSCVFMSPGCDETGLRGCKTHIAGAPQGGAPGPPPISQSTGN